MNSDLSRKIVMLLNTELKSKGYKIAERKKLNNWFQYDTKPHRYKLYGRYYITKEELIIVSAIEDTEGRNIIATAETRVNKNNLSKNFIPYGYTQSIERKEMFYLDPLDESPIRISIKSNKGNKNSIFEIGEIIKFYIQADNSAYLRIILHNTDDTKILLLDNYFLNAEEIGKFKEIPYEFELQKPPGMITLQVNARQIPFPPLETKRHNNYNYITLELNDILAINRGTEENRIKYIKQGEETLTISVLSN